MMQQRLLLQQRWLCCWHSRLGAAVASVGVSDAVVAADGDGAALPLDRHVHDRNAAFRPALRRPHISNSSGSSLCECEQCVNVNYFCRM